jgi:hypothetical protein
MTSRVLCNLLLILGVADVGKASAATRPGRLIEGKGKPK